MGIYILYMCVYHVRKADTEKSMCIVCFIFFCDRFEKKYMIDSVMKILTFFFKRNLTIKLKSHTQTHSQKHTARAGHSVFFNFFSNKKLFFAFFIKLV